MSESWANLISESIIWRRRSGVSSFEVCFLAMAAVEKWREGIRTELHRRESWGGAVEEEAPAALIARGSSRDEHDRRSVEYNNAILFDFNYVFRKLFGWGVYVLLLQEEGQGLGISRKLLFFFFFFFFLVYKKMIISQLLPTWF